jgi:hypothetical protein
VKVPPAARYLKQIRNKDYLCYHAKNSLSNTEAPRDGTDEAHPETTKTSTEGSKADASTLKPPPQQPIPRRLEEGNTPNRHLSFFQGIIPSLQTLDEDEIVQFQIGVLQLISNVKWQKSTSTIVSQPSTMSRAQFPSPTSTRYHQRINHNR